VPEDKLRSIQAMQERIRQRKEMKKNASMRGVCGFCKNLYRDRFGGCQCGIVMLGVGHVIKKPFDEGCDKWQPREKYQPEVYAKAIQNEKFAKRLRQMEQIQRWGGTRQPF